MQGPKINLKTKLKIYEAQVTSVMLYNEHNPSARGVKMITISRAQRGNSITEPTAQQEVL
jgi:hypothetical protein